MSLIVLVLPIVALFSFQKEILFSCDTKRGVYIKFCLLYVGMIEFPVLVKHFVCGCNHLAAAHV